MGCRTNLFVSFSDQDESLCARRQEQGAICEGERKYLPSLGKYMSVICKGVLTLDRVASDGCTFAML